MNYLFTSLLIIVLLPMSVSAEPYLCLAEVAGGVSYDRQQKQWKGTSFKTDGKYIIKKSTYKPDEYKLEIRVFGESEDPGSKPNFLCKEAPDHWLKCKGADATQFFEMSITNLKFQIVSGSGYLIVKSKVEDLYAGTPYIEIGKCSSL
jgi:hypothetical protein